MEKLIGDSLRFHHSRSDLDQCPEIGARGASSEAAEAKILVANEALILLHLALMPKIAKRRQMGWLLGSIYGLAFAGERRIVVFWMLHSHKPCGNASCVFSRSERNSECIGRGPARCCQNG
jgi:hypothetical protein